MDIFKIEGGTPLNGTIKASGSKNAALPILIATLLTDDKCVIKNVPDLRDIRTTFSLLTALGKNIDYKNGTATITASKELSTAAPYELVKQMRASVLVAGPLLARFKTARVPMPGGCAIGLRPVDIHIKGFAKLGATMVNDKGDMLLAAERLKGAAIKFSFPSVGATQNLMMCASLVPGRTVIDNAAREPEIDDLMDFLNKMGADVDRQSSNRVVIEGTAKLHGASHSVIPDRIETGTYLIAGAATGGKVTVKEACPEHLSALIEHLKETGVKISCTANSITVNAKGIRPKADTVHTAPHPGFPTDLQAPWMAYMCIAKGTARIKEEIFENRFMHVPELGRMGAFIAIGGNTAVIEGVQELAGAKVMASDLRGGAALTVAAMAARGESIIQRVYHIERGYEDMEKKLRSLGVKISKQSEK